jgi:uncharacterized Fe-S cluster-containing protein
VPIPGEVSEQQVNLHVAGKQRLLSFSRGSDVVGVTRDIVALHATVPVSPYLSLWARVSGFSRDALSRALHEERLLVRYVCMRRTLHLIPADQLAYFHQAFSERYQRVTRRENAKILVAAGVCPQDRAEALLEDLYQRARAEVVRCRLATARQVAEAAPELQAKLSYAEGKPYASKFGVVTGVLRGMCASGMLVRAWPTGDWRSNQYQYAATNEWLPAVDLDRVEPAEAQAWLVERYLAAFAPATFEDVQWWTGFNRGETRRALDSLADRLIEIHVKGNDAAHLLLRNELDRLLEPRASEASEVFFLPGLDPYIMGYRNRNRFLPAEHAAKVIDRSGNVVATVWVNGAVVGVWGQQKDASVAVKLFAPVATEISDRIAAVAAELRDFFAGEHVPPRYCTKFLKEI